MAIKSFGDYNYRLAVSDPKASLDIAVVTVLQNSCTGETP